MYRVLLFCLVVATTATADASLFVERQSFRLAERALARGDRLTFTTLSAALEDYPLQPYLVYRDLSQRLSAASAHEVREYLLRHPGDLWSRRLRRDWLLHLAGTGRWGEFLEDYRPRDDDAELACSYRQGLLAHGQEQAALAGIETLWLRPRSQPVACDPLFALWKSRGGLTPALIWARIELAMERGNTGLTGYLAGLLPATEQVWARRWQRVHANPRLILESTEFAVPHPRRGAILVHGLLRWSRQDSPSAAAAMDTVRARHGLDAQALGPAAAQIAVFLAARNHPDAARRLAAVPASAVTEEVAEWRVRVALRDQDWEAVRAALQAMDPALAATPRWTYWRARAEAALDRPEAAGDLYRAAALERDYYGFLAAARLGEPPSMVDRPIQSEPEQQARLQALPTIQRAREFYILGRETEARREWRDALDHMEPALMQQAALLAGEWGWHFQAIVTLVQADHWDDLTLRFPVPHRDRVMAAASRQAIDPAWVLAVIRQESLFQPEVRSPAGARGLMQIMPATGQLIARELGEAFPGLQGLLEPATSIRFGSYYLRRNRRSLQDNPLLASAAYNAGRGRVLDWLPGAPLAADIWAETIPFRETRGYVQRVMEYTLVYRHRLGESVGSLLEEIGTVQPGRGELQG